MSSCTCYCTDPTRFISKIAYACYQDLRFGHITRSLKCHNLDDIDMLIYQCVRYPNKMELGPSDSSDDVLYEASDRSSAILVRKAIGLFCYKVIVFFVVNFDMKCKSSLPLLLCRGYENQGPYCDSIRQIES